MREIAGHGAPEDVWLPLLADLPPLPLDAPPARAVVLAPHPDDEVLAVGGLLSALARAGTHVEVVAVTDGEGSHPGGSVAPGALAELRVRETEEALTRLGLAGRTTRLGLPDGGCDALRAPVLEAVRLHPGDWVLAPWAGDGHPDHEAVGLAAQDLADRDGAVLLAFPVWAWHWGGPADLPWERARVLALSEQDRATKADALAAFVSQTHPLGPRTEDAPVLPPHVLARFHRDREVVFA